MTNPQQPQKDDFELLQDEARNDSNTLAALQKKRDKEVKANAARLAKERNRFVKEQQRKLDKARESRDILASAKTAAEEEHNKAPLVGLDDDKKQAPPAPQQAPTPATQPPVAPQQQAHGHDHGQQQAPATQPPAQPQAQSTPADPATPPTPVPAPVGSSASTPVPQQSAPSAPGQTPQQTPASTPPPATQVAGSPVVPGLPVMPPAATPDTTPVPLVGTAPSPKRKRFAFIRPNSVRQLIASLVAGLVILVFTTWLWSLTNVGFGTENGGIFFYLFIIIPASIMAGFSLVVFAVEKWNNWQEKKAAKQSANRQNAPAA